MKALIQSVLVILVVTAFAGMSVEMVSFRYWVTARQELTELYETIPSEQTDSIQDHQLSGKPAAVQDWLRASGIVGKDVSKTARSRQEFSIIANNDERWREGVIHQYINTVRPGMIWMGTSKEIPFVRLSGKRILLNGKEEETSPLLSMGGAQIIRGEQVRERLMVEYLASLVWIPPAAVREYLVWEGLTVNQARVTMTRDGITASGVYTFAGDCFPVSFTGNVPVYQDGEFVNREMLVEYEGYINNWGLFIPSRMTFFWVENDEKTLWLTVRHADADYNLKTLFSSF
jgi:hypothetical protein